MAKNYELSRRGLLGLVMIGLSGLITREGIAESEVSNGINQPVQADDRSFIERAFEMRQLAIDNDDQGYGAICEAAAIPGWYRTYVFG